MNFVITFFAKILDFLYGLHSNIPVCCVIEWVNIRHSNDREKLRRFYIDNCNLSYDVRYVPCKKCLKMSRFRKLHNCSKQSCGIKYYYCNTLNKLLRLINGYLYGTKYELIPVIYTVEENGSLKQKFECFIDEF